MGPVSPTISRWCWCLVLWLSLISVLVTFLTADKVPAIQENASHHAGESGHITSAIRKKSGQEVGQGSKASALPQWPTSSSKVSPPKGSTTFPNSASSWRPGITSHIQTSPSGKEREWCVCVKIILFQKANSMWQACGCELASLEGNNWIQEQRERQRCYLHLCKANFEYG